MDLFFGRPDDDSTESKHVPIRIFCCNKLLCLTEIYTLYELDKHIGMTNVKWKRKAKGRKLIISTNHSCDLNFYELVSSVQRTVDFMTYHTKTAIMSKKMRNKNFSVAGNMQLIQRSRVPLNTLRTGDADLRFHVTTVQDG